MICPSRGHIFSHYDVPNSTSSTFTFPFTATILHASFPEHDQHGFPHTHPSSTHIPSTSQGKSPAQPANPGAPSPASLPTGLWAAPSTNKPPREDYCGNYLWQTSSCYRYQAGTSSAIHIQNSQPGVNTPQDSFDALQSIIDGG